MIQENVSDFINRSCKDKICLPSDELMSNSNAMMILREYFCDLLYTESNVCKIRMYEMICCIMSLVGSAAAARHENPTAIQVVLLLWQKHAECQS